MSVELLDSFDELGNGECSVCGEELLDGDVCANDCDPDELDEDFESDYDESDFEAEEAYKEDVDLDFDDEDADY